MSQIRISWKRQECEQIVNTTMKLTCHSETKLKVYYNGLQI